MSLTSRVFLWVPSKTSTCLSATRTPIFDIVQPSFHSECFESLNLITRPFFANFSGIKDVVVWLSFVSMHCLKNMCPLKKRPPNWIDTGESQFSLGAETLTTSK